MPDERRFLFVSCQRGVEAALKGEIARHWPDFRFAYSRPGFVTFRLPEVDPPPEDLELRSVFARTYACSLGKTQSQPAESMVDEIWRVWGNRPVDQIHVWQRDLRVPGDRGFEPGVTPLVREIGELLAQRRPSSSGSGPVRVNRKARSGQAVLDCVLVEPNEWWFGSHVAASVPSRFPGGVCVVDRGEEVISRAYWKMTEALNWSQLPIEKGDRCVEIGSAPGGSCQALLARGMEVIGVDPAEMDETLLEHPRFSHLRMRAADVKRRSLRGVRWLTMDTNVTPEQTLDIVESLITHEAVQFRGMILTLKFPDWQRADEIPSMVDRIRAWGYDYVRARQLAFNRREVCVAVMRDRSMRRRPPRRKRSNP